MRNLLDLDQPYPPPPGQHRTRMALILSVPARTARLRLDAQLRVNWTLRPAAMRSGYYGWAYEARHAADGPDPVVVAARKALAGG